MDMQREIGYLLKRAQQALRGHIDAALRPQSITTPQYSVLSSLEAGAGLSSAELARRSFVTPQTMNEIVSLMEHRGLVARRRANDNARVRITELTTTGRSSLADCHRKVREIQKRMLAGIETRDLARLSALLELCARNLEGMIPRRAKPTYQPR